MDGLRRQPRPLHGSRRPTGQAEKKAEKQPPGPSKAATSATSKSSEEDDDCRTPPPFDMLDIPGAMKKMGFSVAAKLAQRWFDGREYALSDEPKAEIPA